MYFKETGFRGLFEQFSVFPLNDNIKGLLDGLEGFDDVNGVLTYGYYDREEGLKLEVLGGARINEGKVTFEVASSDERRSFNLEDVIGENFSHIDDKDNFLTKKYADKFSVLKAYEAGANLAATRKLAFLDECRDEVMFDDIRVIFGKEGLQPEECYVRIDEQVEGYFVGSLVDDPVQDFGYMAGDKISFYIAKDQDGAISCLANLSPTLYISEDDLEDGSMLEAAVVKFLSDRKQESLVELLEILRDSYVWMPCRKLSELDVVTDFEDGFAPDIMLNGAEYFFPIFSSDKEMKELAQERSRQPLHVLKAIKMAKESTKPITGLVLNPFTNPFVIDMKLCEVIEKMKTRVVE